LMWLLRGLEPKLPHNVGNKLQTCNKKRIQRTSRYMKAEHEAYNAFCAQRGVSITQRILRTTRGIDYSIGNNNSNNNNNYMCYVLCPKRCNLRSYIEKQTCIMCSAQSAAYTR